MANQELLYKLWQSHLRTEKALVFENQRTLEKETLDAGISVQAEGITQSGLIVIRGKYPNDAFFASVKLIDLEVS